MLRQLLNSGLIQRSRPMISFGTRNYAVTGKDNEIKKSQPPGKEVANNCDVPIIDYEDPDYLPLPEYPFKPDEPLQVRKQRLIYQSRKRGMLENDLLLSTFVAKYLKGMNAELTEQYDKLINGVSNDWDIYYWATNAKPTPPEYENEIMRMLKDHVNNIEKEQRLRQPDLN